MCTPCRTSRHIGHCRGVRGSAMSSPTSSRTTAARRCWIPRRAQEGAGTPGLAGLHRQDRRRVRALSAQLRRVAVPGRHSRLLTGERQRARSGAHRSLRDIERFHEVWRASRPSTVPVRSRRTWSTPTHWTPPTMRRGSSTPPRRWPESTARSPASCRNRSPSTREARQHLHISLWRDDEPAFAPDDGAENELALHAIAGLLEHLPSITLFGAHSVNAYRRFVPDSFAPATVTWSRDNRSAAVRSLVEADPAATRIELRSGASDANPYWLIASALAAVVAGLEAKRNTPPSTGRQPLRRGCSVA